MTYLIVLAFLLTETIYAHEPSGRPTVLVINSNADTNQLEKKFKIERPAALTFEMPDLGIRDIFFENIIFPESWDDLKKDIFFLELRSMPLNELIKKYPDLKESDIQNLKGKVS